MNTTSSLRAVLTAALLALPLAGGAAPGGATAATLSDGDRQCLSCHGERGLEKTFASGSPVSLHVDAVAFAKSVHRSLGCASCHADVDLKKHPGSGGKAYRDPRELAVAMSHVCKGCHEESFEAHAQGVHGKAQANGGAPLCGSCHGTHDIVRASLGTALRDSCLGCHADAGALHATWLPNSKLHLDVVSCAACHAPGVGKRIELRFYDRVAKQEMVSDGRAIVPVSSNGATQPLDESQLRELVRSVDGGAAGRMLLVGRLEPSTGAEGHRLLPKADALKECTSCHRKGAAAFQNVSLSLVGPDGERVRYEAQKDVLHGPASLESVRGFYAMGGTRIQLLDIVLALAVAGGIFGPLGHLVVRKWLRRKEQHHD